MPWAAPILRRQTWAAASSSGCPAHDVRAEEGEWLTARFSSGLRIGVELLRTGGDAAHLARLTRLGSQLDVPLVACGDVHMHLRARQPVQDALTAIRLGVALKECRHAAVPERGALPARARAPGAAVPAGPARRDRGGGRGVPLQPR